MQSVTEWAQENFGGCDLGDKRRTRRLVQVAEEFRTTRRPVFLTRSKTGAI